MCARLLSSFQLQQSFFSMSVASTQPEPTPILAPVPEAKAAAAPAPVPLKGQFMGVKYPLASFASTPHNVACISFLLGGLWAAGMLSASTLVANHSKQLIWSPSADASALAPQGLVNAIFSPFLGFYLASWAFFHLMEFVITSMYNPGKLSVSSFLLDNGMMYHIAHLVGITEYILEEAYLPAEWRKFKHLGGLVFLGFGLIVGGQVFRSYAMISASSNFSHIVAVDKLASHQLVKTGIYSWSRHPSYAGFTWWAVGTQIFLGNPFAAIAFFAALYAFFSHRILIEEMALVKFFGDDYIKYRAEVPTRILFIS